MDERLSSRFSISSSYSEYDHIKSITVLELLRSAGFHYLIAAIVLLSISIGCTHIFLDASLFTNTFFTNRYWGNFESELAYTKGQWTSFVLATYLFPTSIMALIIFMINAFKSHLPILWKFVTFYSLFILAIVCVIQSYTMANDLFKCGIFCWGNNYISNDDTTNESHNYSAQYTFGSLWFLTSLIFI